MTPVQIAYFKHFLFDRGIQSIYISMYRKSRIKGGPEGDEKGNPESLEQFLQEQPYFRIIMNAFYFPMNSDFGYDYWQDINRKWRKYWEMHEDNPNNEKVVVLKGPFDILRQNWDSSQYWKKETMEATYARMHMEPPLKNVDLEKAFTIPDEERETTEDILSSEENKAQAAQEEVRIEGVLDGFSLVETVNPHGGRRISLNTVVVNLRNKGYRITFSTKQSDALYKHGYEYVKLLTKQDTKEVALIFNNLNGCKVTIKRKSDKSHPNVVINSKDIVEHIHKFYNLKKDNDYFILNVTATIKQDNNTIFKLKLKE